MEIKTKVMLLFTIFVIVTFLATAIIKYDLLTQDFALITYGMVGFIVLIILIIASEFEKKKN